MRVGPLWKRSFYISESPPLSALTVDRASYRGIVSAEPAVAAATEFRDLLQKAGIRVSGPAGAGKYTLALMLTMAIQCERQPRDLWSNGQSLAGFCGRCHNCVRIASAIDLETLESNVPGIYVAGVIIGGRHTGEIFIENGRFHGRQIIAAMTGKGAVHEKPPVAPPGE